VTASSMHVRRGALGLALALVVSAPIASAHDDPLTPTLSPAARGRGSEGGDLSATAPAHEHGGGASRPSVHRRIARTLAGALAIVAVFSVAYAIGRRRRGPR
jgi:hypothetical protein